MDNLYDTVKNTAINIGGQPVAGLFDLGEKAVSAAIKPNTEPIMSAEQLAQKAISMGATNVQNLDWWKNNPNKDKAWAIIQNKQATGPKPINTFADLYQQPEQTLTDVINTGFPVVDATAKAVLGNELAQKGLKKLQEIPLVQQGEQALGKMVEPFKPIIEPIAKSGMTLRDFLSTVGTGTNRMTTDILGNPQAVNIGSDEEWKNIVKAGQAQTSQEMMAENKLGQAVLEPITYTMDKVFVGLPAAAKQLLYTGNFSEALGKLIPEGYEQFGIKSTRNEGDYEAANALNFALLELGNMGLNLSDAIKGSNEGVQVLKNKVNFTDQALDTLGIKGGEINGTGSNLLSEIRKNVVSAGEAGRSVQATDAMQWIKDNPITARIVAISKKFRIDPAKVYQGFTQDLTRLALPAPENTIIRQQVDSINSFMQNPVKYIEDHPLGLSTKDVSKDNLLPEEFQSPKIQPLAQQARQFATSEEYVNFLKGKKIITAAGQDTGETAYDRIVQATGITPEEFYGKVVKKPAGIVANPDVTGQGVKPLDRNIGIPTTPVSELRVEKINTMSLDDFVKQDPQIFEKIPALRNTYQQLNPGEQAVVDRWDNLNDELEKEQYDQIQQEVDKEWSGIRLRDSSGEKMTVAPEDIKQLAGQLATLLKSNRYAFTGNKKGVEIMVDNKPRKPLGGDLTSVIDRFAVQDSATLRATMKGLQQYFAKRGSKVANDIQKWLNEVGNRLDDLDYEDIFQDLFVKHFYDAIEKSPRQPIPSKKISNGIPKTSGTGSGTPGQDINLGSGQKYPTQKATEGKITPAAPEKLLTLEEYGYLADKYKGANMSKVPAVLRSRIGSTSNYRLKTYTEYLDDWKNRNDQRNMNLQGQGEKKTLIDQKKIPVSNSDTVIVKSDTKEPQLFKTPKSPEEQKRIAAAGEAALKDIMDTSLDPDFKGDKRMSIDTSKEAQLRAETYALSGNYKKKGLKALDAELAAGYQKWVNARHASQVAGYFAKQSLEKFDSLGMKGVVDFQNGKLEGMQEVKQFFDSKYKEAQEAGIQAEYLKHYLPQLWSNDSGEVTKILSRITQKPSFSINRVIESYNQGIEYGLRPRYQTISQLAGWYERTLQKAKADKEFFKLLADNNYIQPEDSAPLGWTLLSEGFPKFKTVIENSKSGTDTYTGRYRAAPELAQIINNYLEHPSGPLSHFARYASAIKNIVLSSGIPETGLNAHGINILGRYVLARKNPVAGLFTGLKYLINPESAQKILMDPEMKKLILHAVQNGYMYSAEKEGISSLNRGLENATTDLVRVAEEEKSSKLKEGLSPEEAKKIPQRVPLTKLELIKKTGGVLKEIQGQLFENPLFGKALPAMKALYLKELYTDLLKEGVPEAEAIKSASHIANNMLGGINWEEMGRSREMQDILRATILAPDWSETQIRLGAKIFESFKKSNWKNPKFKSYRRFARNILLAVVSANMLSYAINKKMMWENDPGHTFEIQLGTDENGNPRYFRPFGTGLDFLRLPLDVGISISKGDLDPVRRIVANRLSIPVATGGHLLLNVDFAGRPILGKDKYGNQMSLEQQAGGVLGELSGLGLPQYVKAFIDTATGKSGLEQGVATGLELPFRYGSQASQIYQAKDKAAQIISDQHDAIKQGIDEPFNKGDAAGVDAYFKTINTPDDLRYAKAYLKTLLQNKGKSKEEILLRDMSGPEAVQYYAKQIDEAVAKDDITTLQKILESVDSKKAKQTLGQYILSKKQKP